MQFVKVAALLAGLAVAAGCGGGSMNPGGGGGGTPATVTISNAKGAPFSVAMSTSFQPAEWDYQFFQQNPAATTTLGNLNPHHIRLQGISQGVPQGSEGTSLQTWDFSKLDAITQPVLGEGDHSPEFQIAKAPAFMYQNDDSTASFLDPTFAQFAGYAQNLVAYYNTGGFTVNGQLYESQAFANNGYKITWWGIYNEPSINNNLDAAQYTTMYNTLVPAMQTVDPSIKFAALELCCGSENWAATFAAGVAAQVDVVATHYYSSCNQQDTDAMLLATVPGFAGSVQTIYTNILTNPLLASVPVWVTENNVNADFDKGGGISNCNGTPFVDDPRGSSPFFAGWRPYVFSQLGQAGAQALYHWDFAADPQFGEVNGNNATLQLSYWVDYWLGQKLPASAGSQVLQFTSSDDADLETLPVANSDGSVVVMVANHAVKNAADNNGTGVPFSVSVDVSALGSFSNASVLVIDKDTNIPTGPTDTPVTAAAKITIDLNGYAVGFLTLKP